MYPYRYMHKNGKCEDFLQFAEKRGFDALEAQNDDNGLDCVDNALEWLNRSAADQKFVLAEFGVIVAIPA